MNSQTMSILLAEDTIAAIATASGMGAIGIVRISGPRSIEIAEACFQSNGLELGQIPCRKLTLGQWLDGPGGELLDEVLIAVMRSPRSYTCEDVVEVYGHGGPLVLSEILRSIIRLGARPAEPGEFTFRAFRNGRINLLQAEAVMDLIESTTVSSRRLALRSLRGEMGKTVSDMREKLHEVLVQMEAHLEFPMEEIEAVPEASLRDILIWIKDKVKELLDMASRRELYRRGVYTLITGRPNVGKSLFFNRLVGRSRALVTPYAGTTRDTLEETVRLGQVELLLVDSAGGADHLAGELERLGIERAIDAAKQADMIWFVIDASEGITPEDVSWLGRIRAVEHIEQKEMLLLFNKMDLADRECALKDTPFENEFPPERRFKVSAKTGEGIDEFIAEVESICRSRSGWFSEEALLINPRQQRKLVEIESSMKEIFQALQSGITTECLVVDLHRMMKVLDELDGTRPSEDLMGEIFSRFCIGK